MIFSHLIIIYLSIIFAYSTTVDIIDLKDQSFHFGYFWKNKLIGQRFRLKGLLGSGAFANIYEGVYSKDNQQIVAIKAMQVTPETIQYMRQEVDALVDLQGNPYICQVHAIIKYSNWWFLVMPKYDGDFFDLTIDPRYISESRIRLIWDQLYSAMKFMNKKEWCHRDIKIENIYYTLEPEFNIRLSDFGLATQERKSQHPCGTPGKGSVECFSRNTLYDCGKHDVWSIGILLLDMVTSLPHEFYTFLPIDSEYDETFLISKELFHIFVKVFRPEEERISLDELYLKVKSVKSFRNDVEFVKMHENYLPEDQQQPGQLQRQRLNSQSLTRYYNAKSKFKSLQKFKVRNHQRRRPKALTRYFSAKSDFIK